MKRVIVVPKWAAPMDYAQWLDAVGQAREGHEEETLKHWHEIEIDPAHVGHIPPIDGKYILRIMPRELWPNKRQRVALDVDRVQQRIALALWKECARLLPRNLTPEAKAIVVEMQKKMGVAAGISGQGD